MFSQKPYILTAPDTIPLGQDYRCTIDFDSIKYKNCLIEVYLLDVKVQKTSSHRFVLEYAAVLQENEYELKVSVTGCDKSTSFTIKHKFRVDFKKAQGRPATKKETEMFKASEETYTSRKYKTFEEYVMVNLKAEKIKCREKIHFLYAIDKSNNVVFIDVTIGKISVEDKLILKKVVEACKDLKLKDPEKQNPYRRTLMALDLTKQD